MERKCNSCGQTEGDIYYCNVCAKWSCEDCTELIYCKKQIKEELLQYNNFRKRCYTEIGKKCTWRNSNGWKCGNFLINDNYCKRKAWHQVDGLKEVDGLRKVDVDVL
jgi:hypothetical protein